jgi:hypothetical protein
VDVSRDGEIIYRQAYIKGALLVRNESSWEEIYRRVSGIPQETPGYYHDNHVIQCGDQNYVVRVRKLLSEPDVEPRMYPESSVLVAIAIIDAVTPELVYNPPGREYMVISHLPGRAFAELYPPATRAPDSFVEFVALVMSELYKIRRGSLGEVLPESPWQQDSQDSAFLPVLLNWLARIYESAGPVTRKCMRALGIPDNPFNATHFRIDHSRRSFRLCHGDIQRPNFLIAAGDRYALLDWEMAVWGDPVWDIACHMHRAAYPPDQERGALGRLLRSCPEWDASASELAAYESYLMIERYRSLVLDCIRDLRLGRQWNQATRLREVRTYHQKLVTAGVGQLGADGVLELFERHWSEPT